MKRRGWTWLQKKDGSWENVKHTRIQKALYVPESPEEYSGVRVTIGDYVDDAEIPETEIEDLERELEHSQVTLKPKKLPVQPPREEVLRHNLTHLPYAQWCPACGHKYT